MIGLFAKLFGPKLAPFVAYGLLVAALIGAVLWLRHDAYQDGVKATDAKWVEAGKRLQEQAARAASRADAASVKRIEVHNEQVQKEKEKLDEAEAAGTSPLDVLFGG